MIFFDKSCDSRFCFDGSISIHTLSLNGMVVVPVDWTVTVIQSQLLNALRVPRSSSRPVHQEPSQSRRASRATASGSYGWVGQSGGCLRALYLVVCVVVQPS